MRRLAALLALVLALAGCTAPTKAGPPRCTASLDGPTLLYRSGQILITGKVTTTCLPTAIISVLNVHLILQEQHGKDWLFADPAIYAGEIHASDVTCNQTPKGGAPVVCQLFYLNCHAAVFRLTGTLEWASDADAGIRDLPISEPLSVRAVDCTPPKGAS